MKKLKVLFAVLFAAGFVFVCGVGIAADKKAEKAEKSAPAEGEKSEKKGPPAGDVLYQAEFEEEDDTDAWSSDNNEIEWAKGGANGSKGCLKIINPGEKGYLAAEKYLQWYDAKTVIDCDYYLNGFNEEFYFLAKAEKASQNVRVQIKGWVKGKWGHAQAKAAQMAQTGKSGRGDNFRNLVIHCSGLDKECQDPYALYDNVVITATDKKKEAAE